MATEIDLGGNTIICSDIKVGATAPGSSGSASSISSTELAFLDGLTAGTVVASKALVVGTSKQIGSLGTLTLDAASNIVLNATTGTQIGTTATQKLAFYGATPSTQPAVLASVTTTAATTNTPFGFTTTAQFNALIAAVNTLIANEKTLGLLATA